MKENLQCCVKYFAEPVWRHSKIFDHIKESSKSLAFTLHSLQVDHSTEIRKPEPELREKMIAVIIPERIV